MVTLLLLAEPEVYMMLLARCDIPFGFVNKRVVQTLLLPEKARRRMQDT